MAIARLAQIDRLPGLSGWTLPLAAEIWAMPDIEPAIRQALGREIILIASACNALADAPSERLH